MEQVTKRKSKIAELGTDVLAKEVVKALKDRGKVRLVGFGLFTLKLMKARKGYNPRTLKYERFPAYWKLGFVPSVELKEKMKRWKKKVIVN